jgi:hypothetical protein
VVIKLIDLIIDEAPAKWREKIAQSTAGPAWETFPANGGYTVHPVPAPFSKKKEINNINKEGGRSQKLILFIRGKAISTELIIRGTNQFPKPPIITGITIKKIITKACAVTMAL